MSEYNNWYLSSLKAVLSSNHFSTTLTDTETFGHWMDTVDCQRGGSRMFGHLFDTVDRQRRSIETFCHWLDTPDRREGY